MGLETEKQNCKKCQCTEIFQRLNQSALVPTLYSSKYKNTYINYHKRNVLEMNFPKKLLSKNI